MMDMHPNARYQVSEIGPPVPEKIFFKAFAIYSSGGHGYPLLRMLNMIFDFDWPSGFRGEDV